MNIPRTSTLISNLNTPTVNNASSLQVDVSISTLDNTLDVMEETSELILQGLEQAITGIGGTLDIIA